MIGFWFVIHADPLTDIGFTLSLFWNFDLLCISSISSAEHQGPVPRTFRYAAPNLIVCE